MAAPARFRRLGQAAAVLALLTSGCAGLDPGNPLIGRWTATTPALPGVSLGTYEFRRGSMTALGVTQEVDYAVKGDVVSVLPSGSGPGVTLDVTLLDEDTARMQVPVLGGTVDLKRVRPRGLF